MEKRTGIVWIAATAAVVLLVAWLALEFDGPRAAAQSQPRSVSPRGALWPNEQATIDLFEKSRPSVVFITTQARVQDPWTRNIFNIPRGSGSGFAWDDRGHIVTNNHVVEGATGGARIRLADGREVPGKVVGISPAHDLAVVQIEVKDQPPALPIGSSADLKVGQSTFAIGNPFGLDWTLTTGIISALDRSLPSENGQTVIEHLIQTDAAINPGNSGGPLLDSAGRLIGVNTAIFSPSGASAGVGFAVPVDTVNRVVPQLISRGEYVPPTLGIEVHEGLNQLIARQTGTKGVAVLRVTRGSAAAAAGLRGVQERGDGSIVPGDVIVEVDGKPVDSVARLLARLDEYGVGDTVRLTIMRDGRQTAVPVKLQGGGGR